jgi:hypothetical protein
VTVAVVPEISSDEQVLRYNRVSNIDIYLHWDDKQSRYLRSQGKTKTYFDGIMFCHGMHLMPLAIFVYLSTKQELQRGSVCP